MPFLSYWVLKTWLEKLESYLQYNMQTQAKKEHNYLLIRKKEILKLLNEAEDSIKSFIKANKNYSSDPIARIAYDRMNVILDTRRELYSMTIKQLETTKMDIVKSVPVVNILDKPQIPRKKSSPKRSIIMIIGTVFAFAVAYLWLFFEKRLVEIAELIEDNK